MGDLIRHLFTPHHTNNYRSKALHIDSLFVYALLIVAFQVLLSTVHRQFPDVLGYATNITVEELLSATNAKRSELGLSPLVLNEQLSSAAYGKAQHMFAHDYWAHVAQDGTTPWDFINGEQYQYLYAGENLAKNFMTSPEVVDAWLASQTHRENLLKPQYSDIGFAVVNGVLEGEETTLVVQMFGTPLREPIADRTIEITDQAVATSVQPEAVLNEEPAIGKSADVPAEKPTNPDLAGLSLSMQTTPIFDIHVLKTGVLLTFIGFMVLVFVVDAVYVMKFRHIRVTGHTAGHILFLVALAVLMLAMKGGAVL